MSDERKAEIIADAMEMYLRRLYGNKANFCLEYETKIVSLAIHREYLMKSGRNEEYCRDIQKQIISN